MNAWVRRRIVASVALLAGVCGAWAGTDDFSLSRAIPSDSFLALHTRGHAGQTWLNGQYERVWAEVAKANFDRDIKRIFKMMAEENGHSPEEFEEHWRKAADLAAGVEWSTLGQREYAFGMKIAMPTPEFVSLMMPPADKVAGDFDGLAAALKSVTELAPEELILAEDGSGDSVVKRLTFKSAPFPIGVTLARQKDVILVGFGSAMVEQSLQMLRGEQGKTLASDPRFAAAFKQLPPATDSLFFVDHDRLMNQVRAVLKQAAGMIPPKGDDAAGDETAAVEIGGNEPDPARILSLCGQFVDMFDIMDYSAGVATTDGMRTVGEQITTMKPDASKSPMYNVLYGNPPLKDPLRYVPKRAGDVSANSGLKLATLYTVVMKFLNDNVPESAGPLAQFAEAQKEAGFDLERDLLSWIDGGAVTFSIPSPSPFGAGEFAFLLKVSDEAKAREMIGRGFELIEQGLSTQGGSIGEAEIEGTEGFRSVNLPMLAMFGLRAPTVGVKDGWLFVAASPEIVTESLSVAAGKADNFTKNERFLKEGVALSGDVTSFSFTDLSGFGEQMGAVLNMLPMFAAEAAKNPAGGAMIRMLGKVGNVLKKLDFLSSSASAAAFDGKVYRTKSLMTYREPPKPPTTAPAGASAGKESDKSAK